MSEVNIKPGVPLTPEQRAKLSTENAEESKRATEMAQESLRRDQELGIPTNPAQLQNSIAARVKEKLENDEFSVAVDDEGHHVPPRPAPAE